MTHPCCGWSPVLFLIVFLWFGCIFLVYFLFRDTTNTREDHNKSTTNPRVAVGRVLSMLLLVASTLRSGQSLINSIN
jgi:hypothetical protein